MLSSPSSSASSSPQRGSSLKLLKETGTTGASDIPILVINIGKLHQIVNQKGLLPHYNTSFLAHL